MDLNAYFAPLRRWWWLLITATLLAGISSAFVVLQQPPTYQTHVTLMVGNAIENPNPNSTEFFLAQQLAGIYMNLANREPIRDATRKALGLAWLPSYNARLIANSQLIEIVVSDTDPVRAQVVANELANQMILQTPTSTQSEDQERQQFIKEQLDGLQVQIKDTQDEIIKLQEQLGGLNSARQIADTQNQINVLTSKLSNLQTIYTNLLSNTQGGAANRLIVIEPAEKGVPVNSNKWITVIIAAAIGFVLAAGAAYGIEYLDDTFKTGEDVTQALKVPVIGYITSIPTEKGGAYIIEQPRSPVADAFRALRTNLEFAGVDRQLKTLLIASPGMSDGKTTIAINLAVALTQVGKKVILMDADLRRPMIRDFLDLPSPLGLTDVFLGDINVYDVIQTWDVDKHLAVIAAGTSPPNPSELLASKKIGQIFKDLEKVADIIVIDGPPSFVPESMEMSTKTDGVLMVVRSGQTRKGIAVSMVNQIRRVNGQIIGAVLNEVPRGSEYYEAYYKSAYYTPKGSQKGKGSAITKLGNLFSKRKQAHSEQKTSKIS